MAKRILECLVVACFPQTPVVTNQRASRGNLPVHLPVTGPAVDGSRADTSPLITGHGRFVPTALEITGVAAARMRLAPHARHFQSQQ